MQVVADSKARLQIPAVLGLPAIYNQQFVMEHTRATITIFACTISGGLVALPATYQLAGFIPSLILTLIAAATNGISLLVLSHVSRRTAGLKTYGEVALHVFGPISAALVDTTVGLFLIGVLAGTQIVVRDWWSSLLAHDTLHTRLATAASALCIVFPLSLPRSIGVLAYASTVSIAAFSLLVGVLIYYGGAEVGAAHAPGHSLLWPAQMEPLVIGQSFNVLVYTFACQFQLMSIYQDLRGRLAAAAAAMPAFGANAPPPMDEGAPSTACAAAATLTTSTAAITVQPLVHPSMHTPPSPLMSVVGTTNARRLQVDDSAASGTSSPEMQPASAESSPGKWHHPDGSATPRMHFPLVLLCATGAMLLLFCATGIFGVLAFPGVKVNGNILVSLEAKALGKLTYACLSVGVVLSAPLLVHPARSCLLSLSVLLRHCASAHGQIEAHQQQPAAAATPSTLVHTLLTFGIVSIALLTALFVEKIMALIGLLGAFCICPLGLAFPALAILRLPPSPTARTVVAGSRAGSPRLTAGLERLMPTRQSGDLSDHGGSFYRPGAAAHRLSGCFFGHGAAMVVACAWLVCVAAVTVGVEVANLIHEEHANLTALEHSGV